MIMARAKLKADDSGEVKTKDFALAKRIYLSDIKKANTDAATSNGDASAAYKEIKKGCNIQPDAARKGFRLMDRVEEAKRGDWFRGFVGVVNEMAGRTVLTFHDTDMVDAMERQKPQLVTIPTSDGSESDLSDAADD
jgi:hypothetical protein